MTFSCSVTGGLQPFSYQWQLPLGRPVGAQPTYQITSSVALDLTAYCVVTDGQGTQGLSSATATFTGAPTPPATPSVSVSANPNPAVVNTTVTFTCNASGGNGGPYTYAWGNAASGSGRTATQTFTSPGNYTASCTVTDSAGGQGFGSRTVSVSDVAAPPAPCADVTYPHPGRRYRALDPAFRKLPGPVLLGADRPGNPVRGLGQHPGQLGNRFMDLRRRRYR